MRECGGYSQRLGPYLEVAWQQGKASWLNAGWFNDCKRLCWRNDDTLHTREPANAPAPPVGVHLHDCNNRACRGYPFRPAAQSIPNWTAHVKHQVTICRFDANGRPTVTKPAHLANLRQGSEEKAHDCSSVHAHHPIRIGTSAGKPWPRMACTPDWLPSWRGLWQQGKSRADSAHSFSHSAIAPSNPIPQIDVAAKPRGQPSCSSKRTVPALLRPALALLAMALGRSRWTQPRLVRR
jgi:hypothetical protein